MALKNQAGKKKKPSLKLGDEKVVSNMKQNGIQLAPLPIESFQSSSENSCVSEKGQSQLCG